MACEKMSVCISAQEEDLEEEHASGPDRRCASEPRKDIPRDDWLYLKQQKGTEKDRKGEGDHGKRDRRSRSLRRLWLPRRICPVPPSSTRCHVGLGRRWCGGSRQNN